MHHLGSLAVQQYVVAVSVSQPNDVPYIWSDSTVKKLTMAAASRFV